jgi:methionine synthase I (cobalamin-dependent)
MARARTDRDIANHLHSLDVVDEETASAARRALSRYQATIETAGLTDEGIAIARRHATILRTKLATWERGGTNGR